MVAATARNTTGELSPIGEVSISHILATKLLASGVHLVIGVLIGSARVRFRSICASRMLRNHARSESKVHVCARIMFFAKSASAEVCAAHRTRRSSYLVLTSIVRCNHIKPNNKHTNTHTRRLIIIAHVIVVLYDIVVVCAKSSCATRLRNARVSPTGVSLHGAYLITRSMTRRMAHLFHYTHTLSLTTCGDRYANRTLAAAAADREQTTRMQTPY